MDHYGSAQEDTSGLGKMGKPTRQGMRFIFDHKYHTSMARTDIIGQQAMQDILETAEEATRRNLAQ